MLGRDLKGKLSPFLYAAGIGFAFVRPWIADLLYAVVAAIGFVPTTHREGGRARALMRSKHQAMESGVSILPVKRIDPSARPRGHH
jgi:hypothetical protein